MVLEGDAEGAPRPGKDGHGVELFGLDSGTGRVFTIVPILAFCIVFGLSMDYEVFLVSRVAEARRSGLSEDEAIVEGLARTGSVITNRSPDLEEPCPSPS